MTTKERVITAHIDIDKRFDEIVTALLPGDSGINILVQPDWETEPAERIRSQLETLAVLYAARCDALRFDYNGLQEEVVSFATRSHDGEMIDEVYSVIDSYNSNAKDEHRHTRDHIVDMYSDDGTHHRIRVLSNGALDITARHGSQVLEVDDIEGQAAILFDYRLRLFNIVEAMNWRDADERAADDADALQKLHIRRYGGLKVVTATE